MVLICNRVYYKDSRGMIDEVMGELLSPSKFIMFLPFVGTNESTLYRAKPSVPFDAGFDVSQAMGSVQSNVQPTTPYHSRCDCMHAWIIYSQPSRQGGDKFIIITGNNTR